MASTGTRNQGKTAFLKEFLLDNPKANPAAANEAWAEAGMPGTVSASLVNKLRAQLNLTGNLRAGRKRKDATATGTTTAASRRSDAAGSSATGRAQRSSGRDLHALETELDRLIFRVMAVDGLDDVAERLRDARRELYAHYHRA